MVLPPWHPQVEAAQAKAKAAVKSKVAKARTKKEKGKKVVSLDSLKQINLNAAGLDIGAAEIWTAVPEGRDETSVRAFQTFTVDLYALADWLEECGVETVAMESTGIYWIPVYEILEARGFELYLVNARHIKNVPGKKTDVLDCQWIQQLHTYGLLQASFRPDDELVALRSYTRHRASLIRYRSAHIQHMQKALQLMNVQLTNVISDITGETGLKIIRAIVADERNPLKLAQFRDRRCAKSEAEIAKSLEGNYRPEHVFALKQALELYDFYNQQIKACDDQLEKKYATFKPKVDIIEFPLKPRTRKRRKHEPDFDLRSYLYQLTGVDLTRIDGLEALSVHEIISEIGLDMSQWPTVKHFTAWLGLAPNNKITGGKIIGRATKKVKNRAAQALRLAAQSLSNSDSALGAFYRRIRARKGAMVANVATAHKLARIIYFMLKNQEEYHDSGADYYEEQYRKRAVANLKRKAKKLGLEVIEPSLA